MSIRDTKVSVSGQRGRKRKPQTGAYGCFEAMLRFAPRSSCDACLLGGCPNRFVHAVSTCRKLRRRETGTFLACVVVDRASRLRGTSIDGNGVHISTVVFLSWHRSYCGERMTFGANWLETLFCERCGRYREPKEALTQSVCANCGARPDAVHTTVSYEVPVRPTALLLELQDASAKRVDRPDESAHCTYIGAIETTSESARQVVRGGESCPNCHGQELFYETVQMRSADEGQTILYQCCRCRTRFTQHS